MGARVAVLIVAYDSEADIAGALQAVSAQDVAAEIHVWDNASRDRTREIAAEFGAHVHASDLNLGFCAANNRLLALTDAPLVLFLNPDAKLKPGCLARLMATLKAAPKDIAAVGPKSLKPATAGGPRLIDSAGIALSRRRLSPHDRGQSEPDRGQFDAPEYYFGPSFACALWRRGAIDALTIDRCFLDEDYFAYYEDVDVAWRAQRLGWRFLYEPRAVCEHRRGMPEQHGPTLAARAFVNRYLLLIANENGERGWGYLAYTLPRELARLIWKTLTVRGFGVAWRMLAADWGRAWRKRRAIKHRVGALLAAPQSVQAGAPALHRTLPRELDLIIVNHNTRDLLAACLRSVRENSFTGAMRIIVVDSASSDGSAEKAAADFPEVEVIALPDNRGFGHAANVGLRMASGETAFVLNADTELTPSLLGGLYDELHADPVIGAVAPRHLGTDGQIQLTCGGQVTIRSEWARRQRHLAKNPVEPPVERDVAWLSGSALMLKREALRRAGLFDERFNLYFEDIDLCLRIGAAGFAVRYVPTLTVKHVGGASTVLDPQRADFEYRRSQLLFWRKHAGSLARLAVRAWVALRYLWLARSNDAPHAKRVLALLWKGTP